MPKWERIDQLARIRQARLKVGEHLENLRERFLCEEQTTSVDFDVKAIRQFYTEWLAHWLAVSDEEHFADGDNCVECDLCHAKPRFVWRIETSRYPDRAWDDIIGIVLCEDCILRLAEQVQKAQEVEKHG